MSMASVKKLCAVVGAAAVVSAYGALTIAPVASASPGGVLCSVDQNTYVFNAPGGSRIYTIDAGGGFRLHEFSFDGAYAFGHGNGHSDGWIRNDGRLHC